jgi:hypothetical protein
LVLTVLARLNGRLVVDDLEEGVMQTVATHVANLVAQLERIGLRRDLVLKGLERGVREMRENTRRETN